MNMKLLAAFAAALLLAGCDGDAEFSRVSVNPWEWGAEYGIDQGVIVSGQTRTLYLAGQVSVDETGAPTNVGDTRGQFSQAFDNLDAVLAAAEMDRADVVHLRVYTTDVPGIFESWDVYVSRYAEAGHTPAVTLIGVANLYLPEVLVEIEAIAVD